jgi:hypothetical protein
MPTPEAALAAALSAEPTVSAHLAARVFPVGGRQGTDYPYATYQRVSTVGAAHLDGAADLEWPRFQIDVWGASALAALNAAEAIRAFLDATERSGAGLSFLATFQDQRGPTLDEETRNFGCSQDYLIWYGRI